MAKFRLPLLPWPIRCCAIAKYIHLIVVAERAADGCVIVTVLVIVQLL